MRAAVAGAAALLLAGCGAGEAAPSAAAPATLAAAGASNPTVAAAPRSGGYYVAWIARDGGEADVYLAASGPDGASFGAPVRVNDVPGDAAPHEQAPAQVAAGPEGNVYVLWQNNTTIPGRRFPASDLRLARSTDGGRTFAPAVTVNDDAGGPPSSHTFHDLAVGADGTVFVSWIDSRARDAARGEAPAAAPAEAMHAGHGGAGMDEAGLPGSEIRVARSTDGGRTFGPSAVVDTDACPCCRTSLALGPDGALYVAWRKEFGGDVRDVVVARSAPGELRFSAPVRVHRDEWSFPACPHAGPSLAVDDAGRVHVAWYTGKEGRQGLWYAASGDAGASFGVPAPILTAAWVPPSQARLAALPGGDVRVAWEDRRGEEKRVRLGRIAPSGALREDEGLAGAGTLPEIVAGPGGGMAAWLEGESVRARPLAR